MNKKTDALKNIINQLHLTDADKTSTQQQSTHSFNHAWNILKREKEITY